MPTAARQLADHLIPGGLEEFVLPRRREGQSWPTIARAVYDATNRKLSLSPETLRAWFAEMV